MKMSVMNTKYLYYLLTILCIVCCTSVAANGNTTITHTAESLTGPDAVVAANNNALRQPNIKNYTNSIMKFRYAPGAVYHIYAAPLRITDIQLQEGETITSVGAGDTARWQVSKTYSGSGDERREHLLIKPAEDDLENVLVITTSQRTYHLLLTSTADVFMTEVTWRYPQEKPLSNYDPNAGETEPLIDIKNMDFAYETKIITGNVVPDWNPTMIFNDGKKTYIKFSQNMQETPTLFAGDAVKNSEIINYRVVGNYYIVDSILLQAQLRSGQNQVILQISHK